MHRIFIGKCANHRFYLVQFHRKLVALSGSVTRRIYCFEAIGMPTLQNRGIIILHAACSA